MIFSALNFIYGIIKCDLKYKAWFKISIIIEKLNKAGKK